MNVLKSRRIEAGETQQGLEEKTGIAQADLSKMERGEKMMSDSIAERLAQHLPGTSASELLFSNKALAFKKAQERGDRVGVLKAARSIVEYAERLPSDPELERVLERLVDRACKFAETPQDPVYYGSDPDEGRDLLGRRVEKAAANASDEGAYPLHPGHLSASVDVEDLEEEDYDDWDEGRDIYGNRIA